MTLAQFLHLSTLWDLILALPSWFHCVMSMLFFMCSEQREISSSWVIPSFLVWAENERTELAVGDQNSTKCLKSPSAALMQHLAGFLS